MKLSHLLILSAATLTACTNEADDVILTLTADKTTVAVGEPVIFTLQQDVQSIAIFTGDAGHDYYKSGAYVLRDATEEQLLNEIYRPVDPSIKRVDVDLADSEPGSTEVAGGKVEVVRANDSTSLIGSEAAIVFDPLAEQNVLRVNSVRPDWWYQALRIHLNSPIGTDRNLHLTMRFDYPHLSDIATANPRPDVGASPVVIRLAGKGEGDTEPIFCEDTVWDIFWMPSTEYTTYDVDLSRIITAWEGASGRLMKELSYVQILFTATGGVGYVGPYYLAHASFSDRSYLPYDTGEVVPIPNGPGRLTYTHTYTTPGTYKAVALGTNASFKNYSAGGYKDTMDGNVSASEYNYERKTSEVTITVK